MLIYDLYKNMHPPTEQQIKCVENICKEKNLFFPQSSHEFNKLSFERFIKTHSGTIVEN